MVIRYNRRTLPYKVFLALTLIVEMHYFGLFTLPQGIEFILYTNKAKWIGALSVIVALICWNKHKSILKPYIGFMKKYLVVVEISIILISFYTIIAYPKNSLITTYGFASYYLYAFLAVPILYIYAVEGGYEGLFRLFNIIAIGMYIVTIINGLSYMRTGRLLSYSSLDLSGELIRDGKVRLSSGALGFLMIIYNVYKLYCLRRSERKKIWVPVISVILGFLSIYFTGNSRVMLMTLFASVGVLIFLGDGSEKKKLVTIVAVIAGIVILFGCGVIEKMLSSFSSTGELGGSSIARIGAYKYYWDRFINNPLFANGFVGDEKYYDIVHGTSGIYYQTVYVRFFYDDVGIVGQLAILGIFILGIYIWPLFRIIKIGIRTCKNYLYSNGKLVMALACYLVCTTPTLIVLDAGRVIAFPIILATTEFIYTTYLERYKRNEKSIKVAITNKIN